MVSLDPWISRFWVQLALQIGYLKLYFCRASPDFQETLFLLDDWETPSSSERLPIEWGIYREDGYPKRSLAPS